MSARSYGSVRRLNIFGTRKFVNGLPDTDYTTGTEFHIEWALVHHLSKTLAVGIAGYHYQQVTGDMALAPHLVTSRAA